MLHELETAQVFFRRGVGRATEEGGQTLPSRDTRDRCGGRILGVNGLCMFSKRELQCLATPYSSGA